jgi:hypothetical protein
MTSIILSTLIATALTGAIAPVAAATYDIIRSHAGDKFFDGLTFFDGYDNTSAFAVSFTSFGVDISWLTMLDCS